MGFMRNWQPRLAGRALVTAAIRHWRSGSEPEPVSSHWLLTRGVSLLHDRTTVLGGFPGSTLAAQRLPHASMILTAGWLVIGEGTVNGFALPLSQLAGAGVVRYSRRHNPAAVIHWQAGNQVSTFGLLFPGVLRDRHGTSRAARLVRALVASGVPDLGPAAAPACPPVGMSWEDAASWADQPILFSSHATATTDGWFGDQHVRCSLWLTDQALFWSAPSHRFLCGIPLDQLIDADHAASRLAIGIDHHGLRFPVLFETEAAPNLADQLRQLGIHIAPAQPAVRPWARQLTPR